jgi:hypothetical protein
MAVDHFMHISYMVHKKKREYCTEEKGREQKKNYIEDYSNIINTTTFYGTHVLLVVTQLVPYDVLRV